MGLRVQHKRLLAAYAAPELDRPTIINRLIALFDGRQQREAQRLAADASGDGWRDRVYGEV